jgi:hypothetical protein
MWPELTLVLVLVDEDREKEKLAFVETVRCDCCDNPDADRCRTSVLYRFLVEWEGARCGTSGASGWAAGATVCWPGVVKKQERWFGSGDRDLFAEDDSTSGLVGGVVPDVSALSDMSSSDFCDEPVEEADLRWMSGALYDSMFVV